jgi:hypothetical protein
MVMELFSIQKCFVQNEVENTGISFCKIVLPDMTEKNAEQKVFPKQDTELSPSNTGRK